MPISTCYRLIACVLLLIQSSLVYSQNQPKPSRVDTLKLIAEEEQRRLIDPATGTVPYERLDEARRQLNSRSSTSNGARVAQSGIPNITWQERGPSNVGGRTRTLLFDPNDPTHKKVWAGSPAGGLWYTNDITDLNTSWTPVSDNWENTIVTALAADPSNPQIMYAGTGDTYGSVAGGGIWKTTNGGTNWTRLTSSIPSNTYPGVNSGLRYIQRIAINSSGYVFVASQYGVVRSTDGGTNWAYVLAPNQGIGAGTNTNTYYNDLVTDLELATDGILYVAFNPSRVFKSTNAGGTTWTEITPAGITGERTELALAPSTSGVGQVIYAVSRQYNSANYGQDISWFKKSSDGGIAWANMTIPTLNSGGYFTNGSGYAYLNLTVDATDPNRLYAGSYSWFSSTDGGMSWINQLTHTQQQGIWFQPGSTTSVALASDEGVSWFADWINRLTGPSTLPSRSNGYRVGEISSVSMKQTPGSAYLLAGVTSIGYIEMTAAGLSTGNQLNTSNYGGMTFIDEDDPTLQIIQLYNSFYRYTSSGSTQLTSVNSYYLPNATSDYDSQSNTLYVADNINGQTLIRKTANVGATPVTSMLTLPGVTNLASYIKVSPDRTKLYLGTGSAQLYRITNLNQSTPTVTAIDNGTFPQYTSISCIDIGASDDELLVTLSNYGAQSVWYTSNGGVTWIGKDQTNYGLPDVPVRSALFNPQNRKQVLLATDAGVWSTNDITAPNPGWEFSGSGMGTFRVNQFRYRASDGRIAAATNGRGTFTSDAFAIPYTLPTIAITNISNTSLCAGNTFTVSFSTAGPAFGTGNTFEVWLSDANGNFTNKLKIGSGISSPISATLPSGYNALPYGTNYKVKLSSNNPEAESSASSALVIGNLSIVSLGDRRIEVGSNYSNGFICSGSSAKLIPTLWDNSNRSTNGGSYQWLLNNNPIIGATASTYLAQQAGNYTVTVKQGGCTVLSYQYQLDIFYSNSTDIITPTGSAPQCASRPLTMASDYIGETANFQWTRDGNTITGATSYSYTTNQTGTYEIRITDGNCVLNSLSTYLQFGQSLFANAGPRSPGDTLVCTASNYGVSIFPTLPYADNGYSLQWYRNGILLTEMNPATTNSGYYATQPGIYSFILKQGNCQTTSNPVVIGQADPLQVSINYYFINKSACPGETRYMYASSGNGSFQWQKDGVDIAGATSSGYTATASGNYTVRMTRGSCTAISSPVSLTFGNAIQPRINTANFTTESCFVSILSVSESYSSGYQFQWYRNGALLSGSTNSYYYAYQSGAYSVRITNGSCTGLSKEKYASIGDGQTAKPIITTQANRQLCAYNSLQLSVNYYNGTIQWKRNGVAIPGATRYQFYATQSGLYTVVNQDGTCSAESDPIEVKIGEPTTATLKGNALISAGQSALLPVSFTGPAPWSFTLTNGQSVTATYQNPAFIAVSPTSTTTYQLASVGNACGTGAVSGQASVSVGTGSADVSLNMAVSTRTPNVGDVVSYTLNASNAGPNNAVGVQLSSLLPAGLSFISTTSSGVSVTNGVVSANLGTIPANSTSTISFQATPTQAGIFATAAQITSSQTPDPDSQPNSGTGDGQDDEAIVDIRTPNGGSFVASANPNQVPLPTVSGNQPPADPAKADLSLAIQVDKLTPVVSQNDIVTTTLTVNNRGGSSASSVIVQVVLPNGSFSAQSPVGWIQVDSQTYKRYINALAAGQSTTVSLKWQPAGSGTLKAQILDLAEPDSDSTPGNGYTNGEDDEAILTIRAR